METIMTHQEIKELFAKHGYIMKTVELHAAKIHYPSIQKLLEDGIIEKIKWGYYHFVDDENYSEAKTITRLLPEVIFCMDTALFYYGYSDRTPSAWHLAVDKDAPKQKLKIDYPFIKAYFFEPSILRLGVRDGEIEENPVRIYDRDRTICDCLRYMGKMDKEIFNKAIQSYVADPEKSIPNLMKYAKPLRVQKKVKDLIGVWL